MRYGCGVWCGVCGRVRVGWCQGREGRIRQSAPTYINNRTREWKGVYQKRGHGEYGPTQEAKLEAKARCEARIKSEARDQPMRIRWPLEKNKGTTREHRTCLLWRPDGNEKQERPSWSLSDLGQMVQAGRWRKRRAARVIDGGPSRGSKRERKKKAGGGQRTLLGPVGCEGRRRRSRKGVGVI